MSNDVILNNIEHQDLKVIPKLSAEYGDNKMCIALLISEIRDAQKDFPVVFHKDEPTKTIYPMALFGFDNEENLFLGKEGWNALAYQPILLKKGPFKIGHQHTPSGEENLLISIDLDDPRVNTSEGEALFLPHGGNSEFTQEAASLLARINDERDPTSLFTQTLNELELLEPFNLEFQLADGSATRLSGFYAINEEKLAKLDGAKLSELSLNGFLQLAYMSVASLSNFSTLIKAKQNAQLV